MPQLSARERRTVRLGAIVLGAALALFLGDWVIGRLESVRAEYLAKQDTAGGDLVTRVDAQSQQLKRLGVLRAQRALDLVRLAQSDGLVSEVRDAIRRTAGAQNVALSSSKESERSASGRELSGILLEAEGKIAEICAFVHGVEQLPYPLVMDRFVLNSAGKEPGQVKLTMSISIWNYAAWKKQDKGATNG
ncbi:MAG: hypothetical protein ACKVX7_05885 [Planctomycetota bacterium]